MNDDNHDYSQGVYLINSNAAKSINNEVVVAAPKF